MSTAATTTPAVSNGDRYRDVETVDAKRGPATAGSAAVARANPAPLGLIGFALTTFVLGLYQCGAG